MSSPSQRELNEETIEEFDNLVGDTSWNGKVLNSKDEKTISPQDNDDLNLTVNIYKHYRLRIYKPLIPLKIVLFFWYGAAAFTLPFLFVYLKQRGVTLSEISMLMILSPMSQYFGTLISGVTADKLGRSKPVLVVNLLLVVLFLSGILFVPRLNSPTYASQPINIKCHPRQLDRLITKTNCDIIEDTIEVMICNVQCPENVTEHCDGKNLICKMLAGNEEVRNFSLSIHVNGSHRDKDSCYYNVSSMSHKNITYSWCNISHKMNCRISCTVDSGVKYTDESENRELLLITTMILFILFATSFTNCYRFMDVTAMSLVEKHDSDFGRERFFSISGILVLSPIVGYIVDATTAEGEEKNYVVAFYMFISIVFIILGIVYYLDVRINSPGKKMCKKAIHLVKDLDVVSFIIILLVLGSAFTFRRNLLFWYLEEMNTPSFLLGLIPSVSSLYGLPFLVTSRWWIKKIGTHQTFILALLGYAINMIGYSFLQDPWYSLVLESTTVATYHLLWVAVVLHSHKLAPEGLTATVLSLAGATHYQLGNMSGGFISVSVMVVFGGKIAFRVIGIICLICSVLYGFYLYIRHTCFKVKPHIESRGHEEDETTPNDVFIMKTKSSGQL